MVVAYPCTAAAEKQDSRAKRQMRLKADIACMRDMSRWHAVLGCLLSLPSAMSAPWPAQMLFAGSWDRHSWHGMQQGPRAAEMLNICPIYQGC